MNLFNISEEYLKLIDEIEFQDGVLEEDQVKQLEIIESELESKLHAYYYIIKQKEAEMALLKDERDRLSTLTKSKENLISRLKESVLAAVTLFGEDGKSGNKKIKYHDLSLYTVNKSSVHVDEDIFEELDYFNYSIKLDRGQFETIESLIPNDAYTKALNKTKLGAALKEGVEVKHASLVIKPHVVMK
jgi:hypothetical protein